MAGINIVKPGIGQQQCIPVGSFILGNLNEVCKADKITLPKKDRIGTGKTLFSYIDDNAYIDQSNRAVSYYQAKILGTFYRDQGPFNEFINNIPTKYKEYDSDSPNILIPEKYLYVKKAPAITESVISARNLPCALTKVLHSNVLKDKIDWKDTEEPSSCDNTIIQYGDSEVVVEKNKYYIYPKIIVTPLSGVYDYHPLLFIPQKQGDAIQSWSTTGNSGSVGLYYKQVSQGNQFLVRPSIRYSLELSWVNSADIIEDLWPSVARDFNIFKEVKSANNNHLSANPLGNSKISNNTYIRYKSNYGSTYLDTLSPTSKYSDNLKKIQGIAIYNNYTNINSGAFRDFERLQEVLFANSDDSYYKEHGLKYGLQRIYDKAFYRKSGTTFPFIIKTLNYDGTISSSLPDSVNFIGTAAFYQTSLDTLTLYNTDITNIPTDCFFGNKFKKLKIITSYKEPESGELLISPNTKLGPASLGINLSLSTIDRLTNNVQPATFVGCINLQTTTNSSDKITQIGDASFAECSLTNSDLCVNVLPNVTNVGMGAFFNSKISGSIEMKVPTHFSELAFANDNNDLGYIPEISFQDNSKLDNFCLYGQKRLTGLKNLINCQLSSHALDGSRVIAVEDTYYNIYYDSVNRTDVPNYSGNGYNDLIYTIPGTSGWFYDAFSKDSYGIRDKQKPVGVYLGSADECVFYKFHLLGGGRSAIHSKLQDYYIHPKTSAVYEVSDLSKSLSRITGSIPFIQVVTDADGIFQMVKTRYQTEGSIYYNYMFNTVSAELCENLTKIVDYAFSTLDHKSFVFPKDPTLEYLGKGAFSACSNLETVKNLQKQTKLKVIQAYTFSKCDLKEIDLPNTIQTIGSYAFNGNSNLSNITFNGASTSSALTKIESYAFYGTRLDKNMNGMGLTTINNIIMHCTEIGDSAFAGVLSPRDVTAAYTAGTVTIPKCCKYLGKCAFAPVLGATQFTLNFTNFDSDALQALEFWAIRPGEDTGKVYIKVTDENCANIMKNKVEAQRLYGYHRFPVEINYSNDQGSIKIPAKLSPGS